MSEEPVKTREELCVEGCASLSDPLCVPELIVVAKVCRHMMVERLGMVMRVANANDIATANRAIKKLDALFKRMEGNKFDDADAHPPKSNVSPLIVPT